MHIGSFIRACLLTTLIAWTPAWAADDLPQPGQRVDIAAFGRQIDEDNSIGVQWNNPREVYQVRVTGVSADAAEKIHVEWWGSIWPRNGVGGWKRLDDPWNGQWVRPEIQPRVEGKTLIFDMPPLSTKEWDRVPRPSLPEPVLYRKTLKVRIVADDTALLDQLDFSAFGESYWKEATFNISRRCTEQGRNAGNVEVLNGYIKSIRSLPAPYDVKLDGNQWQADKPVAVGAGIQLQVLYAEKIDWTSSDNTRIVVRCGAEPSADGFSFVPQDVFEEGAMRLPDFAALVCLPETNLTLANDPGPDPEKYWNNPVRLRINERPELTRDQAMANIPRLKPLRWVPLGVPSARQEFMVGPHGDWAMWGMSIGKRYKAVWDAGKDSKRIPYRKFWDNHLADRFYVLLDTRPEPKFDQRDRDGTVRYLEDGYLPLIHVEWHNGPLHYHQTLNTTILQGDYGDDITRRGDETVVLLTRIEVTNNSDKARTATLNMRWSWDTPMRLDADGMVMLEPEDQSETPEGMTALRGQISMDKPAGGGAQGWVKLPADDQPETSEILQWQADLQPGESRTIYFKEPFVDLLEADEVERLREISYETETPKVMNYWRNRLADGMVIDVPDEEVVNFYKANLWHNSITTDRDPITGLYNQGVGTMRYRVYANEAVMIARSMDMRGESLEAERFIEPMLAFQGHEALKGRFSTQEGAFHSAGTYTHGEYAMNHGFVLWGCADHYLMTRDEKYLRRIADQLVKGCDFLINERQSTITPPGQPRSEIHGLSPASSLEDVVEYQYWFATNAYYYLGMKRVGQALSLIDHPEADRIVAEAEKYRKDLEASAREATTRSAVARLRDGNFVPYVPSRVWHWRHRTEGWIREALYPSLHLATAEVVTYNDPLITWMLDELEDNIFFSAESGYNIENWPETWFELGGVTYQPCLVDTPTIYMARDHIKASLRSLWNTYALSIYPDMVCFAEWVPEIGHGGGPLYKTSDESRWVIWLREMLVWEHGDQLWLAKSTPRNWLIDGKTISVQNAPTKFGIVDLEIRSQADNERIEATVNLPERNPPAEVWLRLRHPHGLHPVRVLVNERELADEDLVGEDIRLKPSELDAGRPVEITAQYAPTLYNAYTDW